MPEQAISILCRWWAQGPLHFRTGAAALALHACAVAAARGSVEALPRVTVIANREAADTQASSELGALRSLRSLTELDRDTLERWEPRRLEDLTGLMSGTVVEPLNAGLSTAIKVRGFALTRLHYGGMPDVQRMYARDLFTVERIEFLRGPAAAQLGITSPGGVVNFVGKQPQDEARTQVGLIAGNDAFGRFTIDSTGPIGVESIALRYRLVASAEDGHTPRADLPTRRHQGMGVMEWRYGQGSLSLDLQEQRNQTPFIFGTVITNGGPPGTSAKAAQIAWDRLFVLEGGAPALRRYHSETLNWQHRLGADTTLRAALGQAVVTRDETLIGYWTVTSPTTVSSYYTNYHDSYRQRSGRLEASSKFATESWHHELSVGVDGYRQGFHFEGVQNIGGLSTSIATPDFSAVDPARLALTRRYNDERIREEGLWVADKLNFSAPVEASLTVRQQRYAIDSDRTGAGRAAVAGSAALTWLAGLSWRIEAATRAWLSSSTGMEANRGKTRDGGFLPPQQSRQQELGIEQSLGSASASVALWQIDLRNLAMTDPADRTAVISAGHRAVDGIEGVFKVGEAHWRLQTNASVQRTHQLTKTNASLGDRFVGVPNATAGVQVQRDLLLTPGLPTSVWGGLVAVGSRMGDAANTVRVPGYVRIDAGASLPLVKTQLQLGVRNLGNIRYVESVTAVDDVFQGPRRQWWLGVRAEL